MSRWQLVGLVLLAGGVLPACFRNAATDSRHVTELNEPYEQCAALRVDEKATPVMDSVIAEIPAGCVRTDDEMCGIDPKVYSARMTLRYEQAWPLSARATPFSPRTRPRRSRPRNLRIACAGDTTERL